MQETDMVQTRYGVLVRRDDLVEIFSDFNERLSAGDFGQVEFYPDVADALVFRFDQMSPEVQQIIQAHQ